MVRETPLHLGHLRNLVALAEMGAIILPPVPAFYAEPHSLPDLVDHMVGKALDLLGHEWPMMKRWGEDLANGKRKSSKPSPSARSAAKGGEGGGQARPSAVAGSRASEGRRGKT
jgi:4-hydroxy-3-polyprenylbenzoate decarboxylase